MIYLDHSWVLTKGNEISGGGYVKCPPQSQAFAQSSWWRCLCGSASLEELSPWGLSWRFSLVPFHIILFVSCSGLKM